MKAGFDIETEAFNKKEGRHLRNVKFLCGASANQSGETFFREHRGLCKELERYENIYAHNASFDKEALKREGCEVSLTKLYDTLLMCWLLDENNSCALKDVAPRYLNKQKLDYDFDLPDETKLEEYVKQDARLAYELGEHCTKELKDQKIWDLYEKIDLPMRWILDQATEEGVCIDVPKLKALIDIVEVETKDIALNYLNRGINIASPKQVWKVLYTDPDLFNIPLQKDGTPRTDSKTIKQLPQQALRDEAQEILCYRKQAKLLNTFLLGLYNGREEDGLVHPLYNMCSAKTGRLAGGGNKKAYWLGVNPQNITNKHSEVRQSIIAKPGTKLVVIDAQQIEFVVMCHYINDPELIEKVKQGVDFHTAVASKLFNVPIDSVTKEQRGFAKNVNFAALYGSTEKGLYYNFGIPEDKGRKMLADYYKGMPLLVDFKNQVQMALKDRGYVKSLFGRRRRFPEAKNNRGNEYMWREWVKEAFSAIIQGTAADLIKERCVNATRRLPKEVRMFLQVHDEFVFYVPEQGAEEYTKAIIEEFEKPVTELRVPIRFNGAVGTNWWDTKKSA